MSWYRPQQWRHFQLGRSGRWRREVLSDLEQWKEAPPSREVLTDLLGEAAASGAAVVVSTHRLDIAERASRCIALFDGQITYDGPADPEIMHKLLP